MSGPSMGEFVAMQQAQLGRQQQALQAQDEQNALEEAERRRQDEYAALVLRTACPSRPAR